MSAAAGLATVLDDPGVVGAGEYPALHELLCDGTAGLVGPAQMDLAASMLDEVLAHARTLKARLAAMHGLADDRRLARLADYLAASGEQQLAERARTATAPREMRDLAQRCLTRPGTTAERVAAVLAAVADSPRVHYHGDELAAVDAVALDALLADKAYGGIPARDDALWDTPAAAIADGLEQAARAGALRVPSGLTVHAIGDDSPECAGVILELLPADRPFRWAITTGWRELSTYQLADALNRAGATERDRLHEAVSVAVGEINAILLAAQAAADSAERSWTARPGATDASDDPHGRTPDRRRPHAPPGDRCRHRPRRLPRPRPGAARRLRRRRSPPPADRRDRPQRPNRSRPPPDRRQPGGGQPPPRQRQDL